MRDPTDHMRKVPTGGNINEKNKVESSKGYDTIEAGDDVIKLLNGVKELMFKMYDVQ
jgi:hypothetical protein